VSEQDHDEQDRDGEREPGFRQAGGSRDDEWRAVRQEEPPPRVPAPPSSFRHARDIAGIAGLAVFLAVVALPHSVPLWMPAFALCTATMVTWSVAVRVTRSPRVSGYLLACGLFLTAWFTYARLAGLWHPMPVFILVTGLTVFGGMGVVTIGHHRAAIDRDEREVTDKQRTVVLRHWEEVLYAVGAPPDTQILEVMKMRNDSGFEIRGRLPRSKRGKPSMTFSQLAEKAEEIAVSERRDPDGVYFSKVAGGSAADFVMHVRDKRTGKRKPVHLPVSNRVLSVNRPFGIGLVDSGREYRILLREIHAQVLGITGSGKSNTINVIIDRLSGMTDVLIWVIDMKGGKTARPWLVPWLLRQSAVPVLDWVATTRTETDIMLNTALKAIQVRAGYPVFEKLKPSPDFPAIVVICDDVGRCFGHQLKADGVTNFGMSQLGMQIVEQGRSEALVLVGAGQRNNVELWGNTGIGSQVSVRIGMRCDNPADAAAIFPGDAPAARLLTQLRDEGDCLVKNKSDVSEIVHSYRVDGTGRIYDRARWAADFRPVMEKRLADALGGDYAERWTREPQKELMGEWTRDAGTPERPPPGYDDEDYEGDGYRPVTDGDSDEAFNREFSDIVAAVDFDPEGKLDPRRIEMWKIVRGAGWQGIAVRAIEIRMQSAGNGVARGTIHNWLGKEEKKGWVHRGRRGGERVWIWSQHGDAEYMLSQYD
jgi:hypothetical protein